MLQEQHQRPSNARQQHDEAQHHMHEADALVIDTGDPVAPEASPHPAVSHASHQGQAPQGKREEGSNQDRLVERNGLPGQAAQQEFDGVGLLEHLDLYQVARAPGDAWEVQKAR